MAASVDSEWTTTGKLIKKAQAAGLPWDNSEAHSALYDASQTAKLFCKIVNMWKISRESDWETP